MGEYQMVMANVFVLMEHIGMENSVNLITVLVLNFGVIVNLNVFVNLDITLMEVFVSYVLMDNCGIKIVKFVNVR